MPEKHKAKSLPSLMCADLLHLSDAFEELKTAGADLLHVDVMDGTFVPNYAFGTDFVKKLHTATDLPLDIHLMVENPCDKLDFFEIRSGDSVSFHIEAEKNVRQTLKKIREKGAHTALALNPATPLCTIEEFLPDLDTVLVMTVHPGFAGQKIIPQTVEKIEHLRKILDENGYGSVSIEADGNVGFETCKRLRRAGVDRFVSGSSGAFHADATITENLAKLNTLIAEADTE